MKLFTVTLFTLLLVVAVALANEGASDGTADFHDLTLRAGEERDSRHFGKDKEGGGYGSQGGYGYGYPPPPPYPYPPYGGYGGYPYGGYPYPPYYG